MIKDEVFIKEGDLIIFNDKHKLYCGDCTKEESYKFLNDDECALCFTSPPYNVGANNYGSDLCSVNKYFNESMIDDPTNKYIGSNDQKSDEEYLDMLYKSSNYSLEHCKYLFFNVSHLSGNKIPLIDFTYKMKEKYIDTIIWKKTTTLPAIEQNVMNSDFEYIYIYSNIKNNGRHIRIGQDFKGTVSNVIELERNMKNKYSNIHKALFPLKLCNKIVEQFTNENDIVLDCFSGLGTNMVSCLNLNRQYRGIEISPFYCQETIKRFLEYDMGERNIKIIRDGNVIPFDDFKNYVLGKQLTIFDF